MKKLVLGLGIMLLGGVFYTTQINTMNGYAEEINKEELLSKLRKDKSNYWKGTDLVQIAPTIDIRTLNNFGSYELCLDEELLHKDNGNYLFDKSSLKYASRTDIETEGTTNDNLIGFDQMPNLKELSIETILVEDLRPLQTLTNLESVSNFTIINQTNLDDFYLLDNLDSVSIYFNGSFEELPNFKKNSALVDISALSDKKKLTHVNLSGCGYLPTVAISKKNNNYKLLDPITLSNQFDKKAVYKNVDVWSDDDYEEDDINNFTSEVSANNEIIWRNIPNNTKYLTFKANASATKRSFQYNADIRIPIRWVE